MGNLTSCGKIEPHTEIDGTYDCCDDMMCCHGTQSSCCIFLRNKSPKQPKKRAINKSTQTSITPPSHWVGPLDRFDLTNGRAKRKTRRSPYARTPD